MSVSSVFATDLHGSEQKIRHLVEIYIEPGPPTPVLVGDLLPASRDPTFRDKVLFLTESVRPALEEYDGCVLTVFGNNDWAAVADSPENMAGMRPRPIPARSGTE